MSKHGDKSKREWTEARGLIARGRSQYLIVRMRGEEGCPWEFPGGKIRHSESPEAALRRHCRGLLGIEIELLIGQPPFVFNFGSHTIRFRYYVCNVAREEPLPQGVADVRWVNRGQLRDYCFDAPGQQVVDWLLEEGPQTGGHGQGDETAT
jgi:ADP-ribose pyrophosphatase YjhB (NUDIX family)